MSEERDNGSPTDHASPYPVSRLAPAFGLVDLAREIALADEMLANRAEAQLSVIASQVRLLQQQAQTILQQIQPISSRTAHAATSRRYRVGSTLSTTTVRARHCFRCSPPKIGEVVRPIALPAVSGSGATVPGVRWSR